MIMEANPTVVETDTRDMDTLKQVVNIRRPLLRLSTGNRFYRKVLSFQGTRVGNHEYLTSQVLSEQLVYRE